AAVAAIDRGTTVANVIDDWDGEPRPQGAAFDIGADEFAAATPTPPPAPPPPPGAASIDVIASADQSAARTKISSKAFSTSAGSELLLAFVSADDPTGAGTKVASIAGGGLAWVLVKRTNVQ